MTRTSRYRASAWISCCAAIAMTLPVLAAGVAADDGDKRPNRFGYAFARSYDAEIAAGQVHRVPFQDDHIMLMEVSNPPGYRMQMHGHPYPSVFARMSSGTAGIGLKPTERYLVPDSAQNGQNWRTASPPKGLMFPTCTAADPQSPHLPVNNADAPAPLHFYRLEFKRLDDDDPAVARKALAGKPLAKTLYENDVVRLVEITIAPGGRDPGRRDPAPAVLAFDTAAAFEALMRAEGDAAGHSDPPAGMTMPRCMTVADKVAPAVRNDTTAPLHYYRIEFKRIDGDGLRDHWRQWYPHMTDMLREQQAQQATAAPEATPMLDAALMKDLVAANRILVDQGVIDVRGHVSVRDPADANRFWIARAMPPGLATATDMQAFDLEGNQLAGPTVEAYSERFIHARAYKARPDVKAVVHAHTRSLVTMSVSGLPIRPVQSAAAFAGAVMPMLEGTPIHDIPGGDRMVAVLGKGGAVMMQGHGVVVVAPTLQSVVGRSVALDTNAQMLSSILQMHGTPVYVVPAANAASEPGNFGREWEWWKHKAGAD